MPARRGLTRSRPAVDRDKEDEVMTAYRSGQLSLSQAAARLGTDAWSLFDTGSGRLKQLQQSVGVVPSAGSLG